MAASSNKKDFVIRKTFEHIWIIKNWKDVVHNQALSDNTTLEIDLKEENIIYAELVLGTCFYQIGRLVGFHWKLIRRHHRLIDMEINLVANLLGHGGDVAHSFKSRAERALETKMDIPELVWSQLAPDSQYNRLTNSDGSLILELTITLEGIADISSYVKKSFRTTCKDDLTKNLEALLKDDINSDIKLVTKDKKEISAHKVILHAQCPIFATMFGSDFLENRTGIVNVDDVSAKTMKILLHFWYTGELLPAWKDSDTIVEFIYAAGKYQMTRILEFLDDNLGIGSAASERNFELLGMTQMLSLKNAEARLLKRVIYKISQISCGEEFLKFVNLEMEGCKEEEFTRLQIVKLCNDIISENNVTNASCQDVKLLSWICKLGIKDLEKKLLKRIVATVNKVNNTDELFNLLDIKNEMSVLRSDADTSAHANLLVRVNSK